MTIFAKKSRMSVVNWAIIQKQLAQLQLAMGAPYDLMMFSAKPEEGSPVEDIYIALPEDGLLSRLDGFKEIERSELPDFLTTLIVREDGFSERFPDIAAKRRRRSGQN